MRKRTGIGAAALLLCAGAFAAQTHIGLAADWRFRPDPGHTGVERGWHTPDFDDADWAPIDAGKRWEDQGFPDVDGHAWYRATFTPPAAWAGAEVWFTAGALNDTGTLYCNGTRVAAFGDPDGEGMHDTPVLARLTGLLRAGEANVLAVD